MNDAEKQALQAALLAAAKQEIRITYHKPDHALAAAESRIGGRPAVPAGFAWPYYSGKAYRDTEAVSRPLSFLAQINLADLPELDTENSLPKSGVLSFFYELETMQWGYDPADRGCARVFYFPDASALQEADFPADLADYAVLPELAVNPEKHISLPEYGAFECGDSEWDDFDECRRELGYAADEMGDYTKLLGYPDVIQNPMEAECETVTRGWSSGSPADTAEIPDAEKADIAEKAKDWRLLFQMGTVEDGDYELMFGDCGHIYFWIREADLQSCNFEDVWLILQCG